MATFAGGTSSGFRGLKINTAELNRLLRARGGPVDQLVEGVAKRVKDRAAQKAPRGKKQSPIDPVPLRNSIVINRAGGINPRWQVGSRSQKAIYVRFGTRKHNITPDGKALYFYWDRHKVQTVVPVGGAIRGGYRGSKKRGTNVFVIKKGYVDHPGAAPNDFILDAFNEIRREGI